MTKPQTSKDADRMGKLIIGSVLGSVALLIIGVVIAQAIAGNSNASISTRVPVQPSAKSTVLSQMNMIQSNLSSAWQSCQANPSCQGQIAAIPDYQQLYDKYSANFSGHAADDLSGWRIAVGIAEGDMKQWALNQSFGEPNPIHSVGQEVQDAQDAITSFSND
jgi:hypothetical protein